MVKGAFSPDYPLSPEHWLNSLGVASIAVALTQKYAAAMIDDDGFAAGTKHIETLDAGVLIDRYGEPGGGIQYKLPAPIEKLLDEYLEEVTQ